MTTLIYGSGNTNAPALPLLRSVRLRSAASAYFNRTPAVAGNRQKWTWFGWVKRGAIGASTSATYALFAAGTSVNDRTIIAFDGAVGRRDSITFYSVAASTQQALLYTTGLWRDPGAWYFIVVAVDTTQAVAGDRLKIYVNGALQALTTTTAITQNAQYYINSNVAHTLGREAATASNYYDGYYAVCGFVNGQQLTPSSFSYTLQNTGYPSPISYTGSWGTNGFYLTFNDISSATATGIGKDSSGNGNNWTPNNISLTAGVTYDSMLDVPTLTSSTSANYCVINPIRNTASNNGTIANANLRVSGTAGSINCYATGSMLLYGKEYWEATITTMATSSTGGVGLLPASSSYLGTAGASTNGIFYLGNGNKRITGSSSAYGSGYTNGDVIGVATDVAAETVTFYKNGVSQGVISGTGIISAGVLPYIGMDDINSPVVSVNFGQQPFTYPPPSGYSGVNLYNFSNPSNASGNFGMCINLYNGNSSTQTITNAGSFKPDLVWVKSRSASTANKLTDTVRGATKAIITESTAGETTDTNGVTAFNSNGFTLGSNSVYNNGTGPATYVAWQWLANQGVTSSNTSGSITSTVSANPSTGFSVVTYTGTGANATVGHGIGIAPSLIIIHRLNSTGGWPVYCSALGNTDYVLLNSQAAKVTSSTYWNNTSPTSSVFSIGTATDVNASGGTYVAYCWAEIPNFSKISSYVGNSNADGPFLYCNFRPKWILQKDANLGTGAWGIYDASRNVTNPETERIIPNATQTALNDFSPFDFVSNGLKVRVATGGFNTSGNTNIVMLFAESPFKYALAR